MAVFLYWVAVLLIVCGVGYFIAGKVRKEDTTKTSVTLLIIGLLIFAFHWFMYR